MIGLFLSKYSFISLLALNIILSSCVSLKDLTVFDPCPEAMVLLSSTETKATCVDRYEYSGESQKLATAYPKSRLNYYDCRAICTMHGKRLATSLEWQKACKGTDPKHCNIFRRHPIVRKQQDKKPWVFQGKNCKDPRYSWGICLNDPSINQQTESLGFNEEFSACRSHIGAVNMIGNLGEWVEDKMIRSGQVVGRFNGGLYPQIKSSCNYTTIAHSHNYRDYSTGCRCVMDIIL